MRALVTGGAGFLGSILVDRLLAAGLEVDALDDLSQGHLDNLKNALKIRRFRFFLGSVRHYESLLELVSRADVVFHLAARVGIRHLLRDGPESLGVNAGGSYTVLDACTRHGTRTLIFSSSEVYGAGEEGVPFSEDRPLDPGTRRTARWYYAVGKICSEKAALNRHRRHGLPVTVVRPFNATGPRQSSEGGMVVPTFIEAARAGKPITVYGTGDQRRTFVAADDLVRQVIGLAMDDRAVGKTFNVGGVEEYTIHELALLVKNITGSRSPIVRQTYREAYGQGFTDVRFRRPDLGRLKRLGHLGSFKPLRNLIGEMAHCAEQAQ